MTLAEPVGLAGAAAAGAADGTSSVPYVGPRPFEKQEERLFFGRDREARDLISLIIANRVFVLYSQSGAGKSSLLNTKVISGLEKEGCTVLPVARVQGKIAATVSESEVSNIFALNAMLSMSEIAPLTPAELVHASLTEFLSTVCSKFSDREDPIILIFDQFEELFSFYEYRWRDRLAFIQEVVQIVSKLPSLNVLFSLREDYIAKLDAMADEFPNKLRARYHLERLKKPAAIDAIVEPAKTSDRRYDEGVAPAIANDLLETTSRDIQGRPVEVEGEFIEPVQLQVVCSNLWSNLPATVKVITREQITKSGKVDEALRKFYDETLAGIAAREHIPELDIRRWIERALITSAGTRGTVFRDANATAGMSNKVVDELENRHLIRGDWRAGAQWYEITHDRLLRPIRESNRVRLEKADRRYWLKVVSAVAVVGFIFTAALTWSLYATRVAKRTIEAQNLASSVVAASSKLPVNDLDLALLLAVEAVRIDSSMSTRSNLFSQVLRAGRIDRIERINRRDLSVSVAIPNSDFIASITIDRDLIIWNRNGGVASTQPLDGEGPFSLFVDGARIYAISSRGSVQTFEVQVDGKLKAAGADADLLAHLASGIEPTNSPDQALPVQPDPDVRRTSAIAAGRLLTVRQDEVVVTDIRSGSEIARFRWRPSKPAQPDTKATNVGLSPDGKLAFVQTCDISERVTGKANNATSQSSGPAVAFRCTFGTTKFWQIDEKRELVLPADFRPNNFGGQTVIGQSDDRMSVAIATDTGQVTVTSYDIRNSQGPKKITALSLQTATPLGDMLFSDKCENLISITGGFATIWSLRGPARLEKKLGDGFPYDIAVGTNDSVAYVSNEGYFVVDANGREILLSGKIARPPGWRAVGYDLAGVALSERKLAVSQFGTLNVVDLASGRKLPDVNLYPGESASVAIDPMGKSVGSGYLFIREARDADLAGGRPPDLSRVPIMWRLEGMEPGLYADLRPQSLIDKDMTRRAASADEDKAGPDREQFLVGVTFSPDGQNFVVTRTTSSSTGQIDILSRQQTGDLFGRPRIQEVTSAPYFVAFSKDGKLLAVSQRNGDILLFDAESMAQIGRLPSSEEGALRLAFSPDRTLLATSDAKGTVALWDIAARAPFGRPLALGKLDSGSEATMGIGFSNDNQRLFLGDANLDATVTFDLDVASWIAQACQVARRELTAAERQNYSLPAASQRTCQ